MRNVEKTIYQSGYSLIEVLIGVAIMGIVIVGIVTALEGYIVHALLSKDKVEGMLLVDEAYTALLILQKESFDEHFRDIEMGEEYVVEWDENEGEYVLSKEEVEPDPLYRRRIVFDTVARDNEGQIVEEGVIDPGTLSASITVERVRDSMRLGAGDLLVHDIYEN